MPVSIKPNAHRGHPVLPNKQAMISCVFSKTKCLLFQQGLFTCAQLFSTHNRKVSTEVANMTKKYIVKSGKTIFSKEENNDN